MTRIVPFITALFVTLLALSPVWAQSQVDHTPARPFLLFVFAPDAENKPAVAQYDLLQKGGAELDRAFIEIVFVIGDRAVKLPPPDARKEEAAVLRKRYHIDANVFRLVLVGQNGFEKMRWNEPVDPRQIVLHTNEMPQSKPSTTQ